MMYIDKELMGLAEKIVKLGKNSGADEVQVTIHEGTNFNVDVLNGKVERLTEAGSKTLNLKVILDRKTATASSSDLSIDTLKPLMKRTIERARLGSVDPSSGLPENQDIKVKIEDLNIFDAMIEEISAERKIQIALQTEAICLQAKGVNKSFGASFGSNNGARYLANSNGFSAAYRRTGYGFGTYLQSGDGDNLFDEGYYDNSTHFSQLMSPETVAEKAIHRVTRLIGARKIETQNVPVIYEPDMTRALMGFLARCVDGDAIYKKQSLLVEKLGEQIAGSNITVLDNGLLPSGPATRPFDNEGVPVGKTPVIENGILKNYLLDTYSARELKMKSTGHAGGHTNFYMVAGKSTPEEIIQSVDKGMILTGTSGFGEVETTGDISKGAFGLWIEGGKIAYPVAEITISGNLGEILNNIEMIGNDLEIKESTAGPTIKIAEMTIGGL